MAAVAGATPDGSETKVISGVNTVVTGAGTTASPYVINSAAPVAAAACTSPAYVYGEDATGAYKKYEKTVFDLVTPVESASAISNTGLAIGAIGTTAVLTLTNPSACFPAVALIIAREIWQITNDSNSISLQAELDIGDGVWTVQANNLANRLNNPPAGMTATYAHETTATLPSVSIPPGGSIVVRTRNRTALIAGGIAPAVWDSAGSQLRAVVFVQDVL